MTAIDLRLKYRFDTGIYPTYGSFHHSFKYSTLYDYKGGLTPEYAQWLEQLHDGGDWKRETYWEETRKLPVYQDSNRKTIYTREYKEWLEEIECNYVYDFTYISESSFKEKWNTEDDSYWNILISNFLI
jgi:hypothetical protein